MNTNLGFIHRFVSSGGALPQITLLLLHGTGGNEEDLLPLGQTLFPGAGILSPRGKVLENGMPRFFRRFAEGVFDVADLKFRANELAQFIQDARREYAITGELVAVGYSNGANIAAALMLLHPKVLAGAALFRAMVPFVPRSWPDLADVKVLLAGGQGDPIVPQAETIRLSDILQTAGASVHVHWHQGGHELGDDDIAVTQKWLASVDWVSPKVL
jgi:predicted esterase